MLTHKLCLSGWPTALPSFRLWWMASSVTWSVNLFLFSLTTSSYSPGPCRITSIASWAVLQRLFQNQPFIKTEKCEFHSFTVSLLRFILSVNHIKMDQAKVATVRKQLHRFLGFVNIYRKFISWLQLPGCTPSPAHLCASWSDCGSNIVGCDTVISLVAMMLRERSAVTFIACTTQNSPRQRARGFFGTHAGEVACERCLVFNQIMSQSSFEDSRTLFYLLERCISWNL